MITEKARPEILSLIRQHYPQLAERNLQDAIADEGTIMHFKAGSLIMDFGAYVKIMPLIIKCSIKVSREDEEGNEYPLEIEEKENLLYLLSLLKNAEQKVNREELKDYRDAMKTELY